MIHRIKRWLTLHFEKTPDRTVLSASVFEEHFVAIPSRGAARPVSPGRGMAYAVRQFVMVVAAVAYLAYDWEPWIEIIRRFFG